MKKIIVFDFLKTLAILMVVFTHSGWDTLQRNTYLFPYTISMAVPIFMVIYGYLCAKGFKGKSIQQMFEIKIISKKLVRILVPFTIAFILGFLVINNLHGFRDLIETYLRGGEGSGGYYTPIMLQLIFISPFLFSITRKKHGLLYVFLLNLFYEILRISFYISGSTYRLLAFRYMFLVASGMYLFLHHKEIKEKVNYWYLIISMIFGAFYIYIVMYTDFQEVIIQHWENTSMMSAFWIVPIFIIVYRLLYTMKDRRVYVIGRASFHIFLTQMVFIENRDLLVSSAGDLTNALVNILICVPIGIVFYYVCTPIEKKTNEIVMLLIDKYNLHSNS